MNKLNKSYFYSVECYSLEGKIINKTHGIYDEVKETVSVKTVLNNITKIIKKDSLVINKVIFITFNTIN